MAMLGVLMLDTRFPRPPGDIGNPASFAVPVRYRVVPGATPRRAVIGHDAALLAPFIAAGRALIDEGATALTTSCGFLVLFQRELEAELAVPVWTSSLLLVAELNATLPAGRTTGVVTADARSLTAAHLAAAGAPLDTPVEGLGVDSAFRRTLLDDTETLDADEARAATVDAAQRLVARRPDVSAIVLECTNMPPYAAAVSTATGRPVHDILTLLKARLAATQQHAIGTR